MNATTKISINNIGSNQERGVVVTGITIVVANIIIGSNGVGCIAQYISGNEITTHHHYQSNVVAYCQRDV